MKYFLKRIQFPILIILIPVISFAQTKDITYDKSLADSLGADSYGMKNYVLAILKTGPAKIEDKVLRDSLFKGHMANINRLTQSGDLIVAGPLHKNDQSYRGIFIFNVKTIEEAKAFTKTDPTITSGIFEVDYFVWYGSAALPSYLPVHKRIEKQSH